MSESTGWLSGAVSDGAEVAKRVTRTFLGVQREAFVCPECSVPCDESYVHDPQRAAFDGGKSPAWTCPSCSTDFVRETGDESHAMDLYGRK